MLVPATRIYLSTKATDLRKSYESLSALVQSSFGVSPLDGSMFVFYNRDRNRLKILYWYLNGFCIWQKRLEQGQFILPKMDATSTTLDVTAYQLQGLMQGLDCWKVKEIIALNYKYT
jgi:transposase